ncbi:MULTISPECIES: 1-acyl-sn-glycerol-3-phosphate acyltransferase [unclassified Nocardioides]|uniref:1-acyl-sn-glycerol-3-phosphate acyltransferase n=1 Tax=unclassified Nocardioides TaxID=2615069 RepID=UPI0006F67319|nr:MULTISPECIES: 1-acyl-sn-glycerol-3-phosphate acyltransferase [unclassified Nocardioides]KQY55470.1 acyl-phosphate glycerol 3-phosphate acyltransferase [Nocardioides sp. Root140]KRF12794.1 acyl-phosphate glycerol 3-phosphate acyltransferase [Nocardioides sp. Soil796]
MIVRRSIARAALKVTRWRTVGVVPPGGIMVGAPHTSNWDWVAMLVLLWSQEVSPRVLVKQELFKGPVGWILRSTGGIAIDRSNASEVVAELEKEAAQDEKFVIVIAAEGTRGHADHWKSGFHRLARQTGLPVSFGFIDGPSRTLGFGPTLHMTDDVAGDMDKIRAFYADKRGLNPESRVEPRLRDEPGPPES